MNYHKFMYDLCIKIQNNRVDNYAYHFYGNAGFAVPCLQKLIDAGHDICGVFTQPDKPKGRGYTLMPPPVKELALQHGLTVYQPTTLMTKCSG